MDFVNLILLYRSGTKASSNFDRDQDDLEVNLSHCLEDQSQSVVAHVQSAEAAVVPALPPLVDGSIDVTEAAHAMPVSFHGPGATQLAKSFPSKRNCRELSFFRILEGRMTKHTVQGGRGEDVDFLVQLCAAFGEGPARPPESVSTSPAGMPLGWDTGDLSFETLCHGLCFWDISSADYSCLDLPFLSCPQSITLSENDFVILNIYTNEIIAELQVK